MPHISGPSDGPVAVTGASGYIGAQVVKNLIDAGYTVRGLRTRCDPAGQGWLPRGDE